MENSRILKTVFVMLVFMTGFILAGVINLYFMYNQEMPFGPYLTYTENAPFDFIKENQIEVYNDKVIIYVKGASLSSYAPTGSMKPVFDENANGIRVIPSSEQEIHVGDIITFKQEDYLVVHRVTEIGNDENGTYYITKGDSNDVDDGKIRFKDIKYLTIGILW